MNGDAKFSRELCMGMPNSLGNLASPFQYESEVLLN